MEFNQQYTIGLDQQRLWETLMDVHKVAGCLTGVERLDIVADDHYEGTMAVKMGPVRLRFDGEVKVTTRDEDNRVGVLEANAKDSRAGGGFKARLEMQLHDADGQDTALHLILNTTFLGRIGELGRPLIKKKINTMMDDFVVALNDQFAEGAADR